MFFKSVFAFSSCCDVLLSFSFSSVGSGIVIDSGVVVLDTIM